MAKTRLNNADRDAIAAKIITHKFNPLQRANDELEHRLAKEAYDRLYPKATQALMAKLPAEAFRRINYIDTAISGKRYRLLFGWGEYGVPTWGTKQKNADIARPTFSAEKTFSVLEEDELGARIAAWRQEHDQLSSDRSRMHGKLDGTLKSFNTFDDLITKFPEAQAFIMERWRDRPEGGSPSVPAIVIKDLAAELDLPPELAEAA